MDRIKNIPPHSYDADEEAEKILKTLRFNQKNCGNLKRKQEKLQALVNEMKQKLRKKQDSCQLLLENINSTQQKAKRKENEIITGGIKNQVQVETRQQREQEIDDKFAILNQKKLELNALTKSMLQSSMEFNMAWNLTPLGINYRKQLSETPIETMEKEKAKLEKELEDFLVQEQLYQQAVDEKSKLEKNWEIDEKEMLILERKVDEELRNLDNEILVLSKQREHLKESLLNKEMRKYKNIMSGLKDICKDEEREYSHKLEEFLNEMQLFQNDIQEFSNTHMLGNITLAEEDESMEVKIYKARAAIAELKLKRSELGLPLSTDTLVASGTKTTEKSINSSSIVVETTESYSTTIEKCSGHSSKDSSHVVGTEKSCEGGSKIVLQNSGKIDKDIIYEIPSTPFGKIKPNQRKNSSSSSNTKNISKNIISTNNHKPSSSSSPSFSSQLSSITKKSHSTSTSSSSSSSNKKSFSHHHGSSKHSSKSSSSQNSQKNNDNTKDNEKCKTTQEEKSKRKNGDTDADKDDVDDKNKKMKFTFKKKILP